MMRGGYKTAHLCDLTGLRYLPLLNLRKYSATASV